MPSIWDNTFLDNTLRDWALSLLIIICSMILLRVLQSVVIRRLKKVTERTKTHLDDFIIRQVQTSVVPFLYLVSIYAGLHYLSMTAKAQSVAHIALMITIIFFVLKIINATISYAFNPQISKKDTTARTGASKGIILLVRLVIFLVALLFLIDNLGYDITTIIAGLGIGGIAIALASQTILADLFNYLAIYFDKPFEPGDFIVLDDKMGTVEYIGIRTTRLRTLGGEQLVCSNTDLTNARVHNYKRMQERRSVFSFGVVYNTPLSKLKMIPGWIKIIVESIPLTRFDRAHFKSFGNSSLDFEVVYYILSPDYNEFMNIQQQINLLLVEIFEKEEVEFAFPTQTVLLGDQLSQALHNGETATKKQ